MLLTPLLLASPLAVPPLARYVDDDHKFFSTDQRITKSIISKIPNHIKSKIINQISTTTSVPLLPKWNQIEKYQLPIDENTLKLIGNVDETFESWTRIATRDFMKRPSREIRTISDRVNKIKIRRSLSDRTLYSNKDLIAFNYGINENNQQTDAVVGVQTDAVVGINTSHSLNSVHNNYSFKGSFLSAIGTDHISLLSGATTIRQSPFFDFNNFGDNRKKLFFVNNSRITNLSKNVRSVSASVSESNSREVRVSSNNNNNENNNNNYSNNTNSSNNNNNNNNSSGGEVEKGFWKTSTTIRLETSNGRSTSSPELIKRRQGNEDETVSTKYGYIITVVAISLIGAIAITLVGAVRCLRATRRASRALALPIPLLPEDRTPLNAEPEHPVPMLSVQSPGCAGMERLCVPARTSLGSPPHDRNHISRRMRVDPRQARDILVRDANILSDRQVRNNHHHNNYHYQHHLHQTINLTTNDGSMNSNNSRNSSNSNNDFIVTTTTSGGEMRNSGGNSNNSNNRLDNNCRGIERTDVIRCPHHVPLPDSEWGQDRDLQIRTRYQQTEITRSYIKPPPNRTVLDVPEQSYNLFPSSSLSPSFGMAAASCNLGPHHQHHHSNQHSNHHLSQNHHHQQQQPQQQQKSKPNPIKNFFLKISSPKSPSSSSSTSPSLSASSSSSSTSSSSSSLATPITVAQSSVTATNCNLGSSLGSLSPLSGVTSSTTTVISSMPTVTTTSGTSNNHQHHFHQTQQQQLVSSTNHHSLSVIGSSCTASLGSSSSTSSSASSIASLATQSIDCCYTQATSVRPRTPIINSTSQSSSTIQAEIGSNNNNQLSHQQRDGHI